MMTLTFLEADDAVGGQFVDTLELLAHTNGPVHGRALNLQNVFDFIQHFDGVANFSVEFVDEGNNRRVAQTTNFHQLNSARLHTLGTINHHKCRIHCGKGAVSVFRKVLVAGCVEQIHHPASVRELHHGRGNRDAPLLLHGHPV